MESCICSIPEQFISCRSLPQQHYVTFREYRNSSTTSLNGCDLAGLMELRFAAQPIPLEKWNG